ncbi:MAG: carboxypeptidase regulatory-like domain-containing protein [Bacteroidetes bacterium]|nr:carboxypeptidase regulatory-like domain-containing protein [Bacteroidota bacterium]
MRTQFSFIRTLAMAVVVLSASVVAAFAGTPLPPREYGASVVMGDQNNQIVLLKWYATQDGPAATSFNIYQASGQTEDMTKFDKIGSVEAKTQEPNTPPIKYTFEVRDLKEGTYTFYIRAVNADGEGDRSVIRVVVIKPNVVKESIWFVSQPTYSAFVGKPYSYKARAEANPAGTISYALVQGPDGMTINAETGEISWTPTAEQNGKVFLIIVKAFIDGTDRSVLQKFEIAVKTDGGGDKPRFCSFIKGHVTLEGTTTLVTNGVVTAWMTKVSEKDSSKEVLVPVYKAEIKQGVYTLNLPAGTYKLRVEGAGFYAEWNENVEEPANATAVVTECDKTVELHFIVTAKPEPVKYVVSGRVTDEATGEGIKAIVIFEAKKKDGNVVDAKYLRLVVETNANGEYEVKLPAGVDFIAHAEAAGGKNDRPVYLVEFYNEVATANEATVINLTEAMTGVSFTLAKRPVFANSISGTLTDSNGAAVRGRVSVYQVITKGNETGKRFATTVETDSNGHYTITNLEPGTYIVFASAGEKSNFVPGWYVSGDFAANEWKNATQITVGEDTNTDGVVIKLKQVQGKRGKGRVRGVVFGRGGEIKVGGEAPQGSTGIIGAFVVAKDDQGNVVDYMISENDGAYQLDELGIGTMTIIADRLDYNAATTTLAVDDSKNSDQQATLELLKTVTSVEMPTTSVSSFNVYPNPASAEATIQFPATTGTASVSILTMTGVVVATQSVDVQDGLTTAIMNTSSLSSGRYLVQVSNNGRLFALPMTIVR